jgi:riboflavin synthase alpha subunit
MFTGLIESIGQIEEVARTASGIRIVVATGLAGELTPGDSLAIIGVCLTVVDAGRGRMQADVSPETARVTTLGALVAGARVNLERSLRADARIGGHFVQGHVDGTGRLDAVKPEEDSYRLTFGFPPELDPYIVTKGSIAVDGVSLTVASMERNRFDVQIIPFTWLHTNLSGGRSGDPVNLECDILGKYAVKALGQRGHG